MPHTTLKPNRKAPGALLFKVMGKAPRLRVVDIGASPLDGGKSVYTNLMEGNLLDVVGFEPDPKALAKLNETKRSNETYLPHAIGDGQRRTLRVCRAPGMSSLLEPSMPVLNLFHILPTLAEVKSRLDVETVRLDDVPETAGADFLKMDIQGAELMALKGATQRLRDVVAIQTEINFVPMYRDQPMFAEIDTFLRHHGFMLHRLRNQVSRMLSPFAIGWDPHVIGSQLAWADAIYVRDLTRLDALSDRQLLALATIAYDFFNSFDLVLLPLGEYDRRHGTSFRSEYLFRLQIYYDQQVHMARFDMEPELPESA